LSVSALFHPLPVAILQAARAVPRRSRPSENERRRHIPAEA
jgi:hypothetical protein